jgi:D-alanyl-lipoteichoic acid acyltransferase DltB (MBOAT superfamily)
MTFTSLEYLFFLPLVVLFYFLMPQKIRWALLLVASYLFYAYWNASLLILIVISTVIDYWAGIQMGKQADKRKRKKFLYASLVVNLGMLFFFKYFSFCNEAVRELFGYLELSYDVQRFDILLPVGISFYTFQTLSYSLDVYRGEKEPESHLGIFALYVSFFPQLVAGPIERSINFLPQFYEKHKFSIHRVVEGGKLIVWGLFKKMVIGDNLALIVDQVYGNPAAHSSGLLSLATYAFTIQVYCDFSGYTDMAIGSAKIFGFKLSDNFKRPFFASNISEFWRRWHMSLTQWIGDYFYQPLLKKYKSNAASFLILYFVLIAIGVWHGAGGQFVLFGIIHATYIAIRRLSTKPREVLSSWIKKQKLTKFQQIGGALITFHLVVISLICFASEDLLEIRLVVKSILSNTGELNSLSDLTNFHMTNLIVVLSSLALVFLMEMNSKLDVRNPFGIIRIGLLRWGVYVMIIFYLLIFRVTTNPEFYYFQF